VSKSLFAACIEGVPVTQGIETRAKVCHVIVTPSLACRFDNRGFPEALLSSFHGMSLIILAVLA
jgi:hypothetical protein